MVCICLFVSSSVGCVNNFVISSLDLKHGFSLLNISAKLNSMLSF